RVRGCACRRRRAWPWLPPAAFRRARRGRTGSTAPTRCPGAVRGGRDRRTAAGRRANGSGSPGHQGAAYGYGCRSPAWALPEGLAARETGCRRGGRERDGDANVGRGARKQRIARAMLRHRAEGRLHRERRGWIRSDCSTMHPVIDCRRKMIRTPADLAMSTFPPIRLPDAQFAALEAAYAEPPRAYHDFDHVREVLRHHADVAAGPGWAQPAETYLAVLYHDAIYEAGRSDNEIRSAELAVAAIAKWLSGAPVDAARVAEL